MAGWDGAGNFTLSYFCDADAALNVKISSTKMDTQFGQFATGLMNCLTRDNQVKPTVDMNWNGKKLTNLANGAAASDAATIGQLIPTNEWIAETTSVTWINATSFKVVGVDATGRWLVGRRVKSSNTAGTIYSTVSVSTYGAPDTTVTVINDSGALDSGFASPYYGILSPTNPSIPVNPAWRDTKVALGSFNTTTAVNWLAGGMFTATATGTSAKLSFSNLPSGWAGYVTLDITNGGLATSFWPAGLKWPYSGVVQALTASGRDMVTLACHDGSTVSVVGFLPSFA